MANDDSIPQNDPNKILLPGGMPPADELLAAAINRVLGDPGDNLERANLQCEVWDADSAQWLPGSIAFFEVGTRHYTVKFERPHIPARATLPPNYNAVQIGGIPGEIIRVSRANYEALLDGKR